MNGTCNKVYKSVIEEHENYNKSVIIVVLSDKTTYNKSIPILKWHEIREVKECFYGTIDFKETAGLEKFSLPQTANFKRGASGWKNMDFTRIWQTLLGHMKGILQSILMSVSFQRFR